MKAKFAIMPSISILWMADPSQVRAYMESHGWTFSNTEEEDIWVACHAERGHRHMFAGSTGFIDYPAQLRNTLSIVQDFGGPKLNESIMALIDLPKGYEWGLDHRGNLYSVARVGEA